MNGLLQQFLTEALVQAKLKSTAQEAVFYLLNAGHLSFN